MKSRLALLLFLLNALPVFSGTESGGGGGVIWIDGRPILIDVFTMIDDLSELPHMNGIPSEVTEPTSIRITSENRIQVMNTNPAFKEAITILQKWQALPFDTMSYTVSTAMNSPLTWSYVDEALKAPPFYLSESLPKDHPIEVAAYYHHSSSREVNVRLSRPIWNKTDLLGQTGLLLHETLRQVQIGFKNGFNDQALQRATSIYLLCKPKARLNYYMFYVLYNSPEMADKIYGPFRSFMKEECQRTE